MSRREVNLLASLPSVTRNLAARHAAQSAQATAIAREYGESYFDGPRECGYGGYHYDGRWLPVARDIVAHFNLRPGQRVLDIGCAKGFLVKDLMTVCPGLEVFGLDISRYALGHAPKEIVGRLHLGSADDLPFPDQSFDAAISINTIHNLDRAGAIQALAEIERVAPGRSFVQVDSYHTEAQRDLFLNWVLTAKFHDFPSGWIEIFDLAGYSGDYYWTVLS